MKVDIIIPTQKSKEELKDSINCMKTQNTVIVTSLDASASVNRNYGLIQSESDFVIMVDDDITGFFEDWDKLLIQSLIDDDDTIMVSARLLNKDGSIGVMVGTEYDISKSIEVVSCKQLPTACVAFRRTDTFFDVNYIGSGFEDNDYCLQLAKKYPNGKFIINNSVSLTHKNERKNQVGYYWQHNKSYFEKKWRTRV